MCVGRTGVFGVNVDALSSTLSGTSWFKFPPGGISLHQHLSNNLTFPNEFLMYILYAFSGFFISYLHSRFALIFSSIDSNSHVIISYSQ